MTGAAAAPVSASRIHRHLAVAAQAACVWVAVATDREDEATNVVAVT